MRALIVIGAGLFAISGLTAANAADLPARAPAPYKAPPPMVAPIYNWGGFYVGVNGGGGSARECYTITNVNNGAVNPNSEGCHDATGGMAGGQIGYRWQMVNWVFGVEAQGDWANLEGSNSSLTAFPIPYTNRTKIDAIGLFTGQVGYAFSNVLLYVKGGAAVTDNRYDSYFTATGATIYTASETRWGGAVGAGIEFGFAPNWSVGLEYDHLFMGSNSVTFTPINSVNRIDTIKQDVDMGTVRINYTFGGPVVARY
jgi:outer membrane immunogenic protein